MRNRFFISFLMGSLMLSSGIMARVMIPAVQHDIRLDNFNLETLIPREFGNWKIDPSSEILLVNPDARGLLNRIYNQTLSRTYINNHGYRVMLSIAYGRDQSTDLHVHRPEICYTASGFSIGSMTKAYVKTAIGPIPVMHLVAKQGSRNEPVTYWIRVGNSLTRGWIQQKLATIGYSLTGKIPDGLLFRISTISNSEQDSFRIQQLFLDAILQAVPKEDRYWLIGQHPQ